MARAFVHFLQAQNAETIFFLMASETVSNRFGVVSIRLGMIEN